MKTMKAKRVNKNRADILNSLKRSKDFKEKMDFVKNSFYPALGSSSRNIDDAVSFLASLSTIIMQEFLKSMKEKKTKEISLSSMLDSKDEKYEKLAELISLFDEKSLYDTKELVEGMKSELQLFINEELKERPLSSLKTTWVDELK